MTMNQDELESRLKALYSTAEDDGMCAGDVTQVHEAAREWAFEPVEERDASDHGEDGPVIETIEGP